MSLVESRIPFIQRQTTSHTTGDVPLAAPLREPQISQ